MIYVISSAAFKDNSESLDLDDWFNLKSCTVLNKETNKWDRGFEILSVK